jgi:hypothetical protein
VRHIYNTHVKYFPNGVRNSLMMATAGPKHVRCFMYFDMKQVTLDGTVIYFQSFIVFWFPACMLHVPPLWISSICPSYSALIMFGKFECSSDVSCGNAGRDHTTGMERKGKVKVKSKSLYDRRSVGQYIMVSSPIWGSWPDINFCLTFAVLSMSGAPSDERSGLLSVLVTWTASVQ